MKRFLCLVPAAAILLLSSCSHLNSEKKTAEFTPEQMEQLNRDALVMASEQLEKMVEQAKSSESSARFLATDLFLKANMSLLDGDFLTASALFKHVVALAPEDHFVQKKYAISLIRMNDLETAQTVLENLYKQSKDDKVGLILAGVYTGLDHELKAREMYVKLLARNPRNEDACVFLSKSYALDKSYKKAMNQLSTCAQKDPKNGMYDYYMGKIYLDQGKVPAAMSSFKKALSRQSDMSQAVIALGSIYEEKEDLNTAISLYEKYLKKDPTDQAILNRVVQALFLKERFSQVIPYAEKLSDLEPENLNLKVKLGILYTDAKKYPEAVSVFRDLLGSAPQSDKILYYLGAIYQEMNQFESSIEYFNQIPATSGLYTDSSVQMANMLSTLAQDEVLKKKESKWKQAFLKHVNNKIEEFKDLRVEFSVIKSGFFEAVAHYKDAMDAMVVVQDEKSFSIQHKYYLANLYEKEKRFEDATSLIMGIIEKEPKNAHAWNFLGYSLLVRGEDEKAFEYIQKALKLSPDDGYIRDSLGWYYYKKGDVKKALSELQVAFKKVPDDVEILKHLAIIHKELKEYNKARSYLETALKHARYLSDREEIIGRIEALESDRIPAALKDQ